MRSPPTHKTTPWAFALLLAACGGTEARVATDAAPVLSTLASPEGSGSAQLRSGDLAGARATFEAALAADPERLAALNDLAVSYALSGHVDAARTLLDEVVAGGNRREQQAALVNLGELYAIEGYLSIAQACLESARGIDPSRPEPLYALALLADARGDSAAARFHLAEALRLDGGAAARASFAYLYAEERLHLDALLAEQAGDVAAARPLWRAISEGRFAALAAAAERRLAEP